MITKQALIDAGYVPNKNAWIGDGWLYCKGCGRYAFHSAYGRTGEAEVFEICLECDQYHGNLQLKGAPMSVASDILEDAKRITERYAQAIGAGPVFVNATAERIGQDPPQEPPEDWGHEDCDVCAEARAKGTPAPSHVRRSPIPAHVFVLLQTGTVLGVLTNEQKAIDEAYSLMNSIGGTWNTLSQNRLWRTEDTLTIIEISAHDVR